MQPAPPQPPLPPPPPPPSTRPPISPQAIIIFGSLGTLILLGIVTAAVIGLLRPNPSRPLTNTRAVQGEITGCDTRNDGYWNITTITYQATNHDHRTHSAFIDLSAIDDTGNRLGATATATQVP